MGDGLSWFGDLSLIAIAGALIKFGWDVSKENRRRGVEAYEKLRRDFDTEPNFEDIFKALDNLAGADGKQILIQSIDIKYRLQFAAFTEYVALCAKSHIFSYELANYEFGDYARRCWKSNDFWKDLCDDGKNQNNEPLWGIFKEFVKRIESCNNRLKNNFDVEIDRVRLYQPIHIEVADKVRSIYAELRSMYEELRRRR
jgi:hypothetical protein